MSILSDILASYRGPVAVGRRLRAAGPREDRAVAWLMMACIAMFLSQAPVARDLAERTAGAGASEVTLPMQLGANLLIWLGFAPLVFYGIAAVQRLVARALGGGGSHADARVSLFWALLVAAPVQVLAGIAGLARLGFVADLARLTALVVFAVVWILLIRDAERKRETHATA